MGYSFKYLTNDVEYACNSFGIPDEFLPYGTMWSYVSSALLNGIVNYGEVVAVAILHRYTKMDEDIGEETVGSTRCTTKREVIRAFSCGERIYHTRLDVFHDDVFVLTRVGEGRYVFFWFDCDVSDCCVGRFQTSDSEVEVIAELYRYADDRSRELSVSYGASKEPLDALRIPKGWFDGWMKF